LPDFPELPEAVELPEPPVPDELGLAYEPLSVDPAPVELPLP
jgi:hypothetical protein